MGILASAVIDSSIEIVHVSGDIIFNATGGLIHPVTPEIGGLLGKTQRADILNVSVGVTIDAFVKGNAYSHLDVGGINGNHFQSTLKNANVTGIITGHAAGASAQIGGVVGDNWSIIQNAFADTIVTAEISVKHSNSVARAGLIIGVGDPNGNISDSLGFGEVHLKLHPESWGSTSGVFGRNSGLIENIYFASSVVATKDGEEFSINPTWMYETN